MSVTITDVAKRAGVSNATASRVLGGYGYVSREKRERVLQAAKELDYQPHLIAKSMVTGRTKTVGLVVGDIENPFFAALARAMNQVLLPEGYALVAYTTNENLEEEKRAIQVLSSRQVDAMVIAPTSFRERSHIQTALHREMPVVLVDRAIEGLKADTVAVANFQGAYEAVKHLTGLGHRRIGFLSDSLELASNRERLAGYRHALEEVGIPFDPLRVQTSGFTIQDGYRGAVILLNQQPRPSAIFAANNFMATGLLLAARDMHTRIPDELSLIGFDDAEWYQLLTPAISAVAQPVHEMGAAAARVVLRRLAGDDSPPQVTRLPTRLILRRSTAPLAEEESPSAATDGRSSSS
jgi:LacI family transcriptional regulator